MSPRASNMPPGAVVQGVPIITASLDQNMAAFDELPPAVRHELNYASNRISSTDVLGYIRDGVSASAVARAIRDTDRRIDEAFRAKAGMA